jgi:hypothetical protein
MGGVNLGLCAKYVCLIFSESSNVRVVLFDFSCGAPLLEVFVDQGESTTPFIYMLPDLVSGLPADSIRTPEP